MKPLRSLIVGAGVLALSLGALTAPSQASDPAESATSPLALSAASVDPPVLGVSRLAERGGRLRVDVVALVPDWHRGDVADLQVSIRIPGTTGGLLSAIAARQVSGAVIRATLTLNAAQARAWRAHAKAVGAHLAAEAVSVGIRVRSDREAGAERESLAIDTGRVVWRGPRPGVPVGPRTDSGQIVLRNNTANPLVLMAGGFSCVYDQNYSSTYTEDKDSYIGQLNGTILLPGQQIAADFLRDASDEDRVEPESASNAIIQSWTGAGINAYEWLANSADASTLPRIDVQDPALLEFREELVAQAITAAMPDMEGPGGLFDLVFHSVESVTGITMAVLDALEVVDVIPGLDQIFAIVDDIIIAALQVCSSYHLGYFMVGASDVNQPWRQFFGVYNWDEGKITLAKGKGGTEYYPYVNGIIANPQTFTTPAYGGVADDQVQTLYLPSGDPSAGRPAVWTFTEPDGQYMSSYPADLVLAGRTVTCTTDPRNVAEQQATLSTLSSRSVAAYLVDYPNGAWSPIDATSSAQATTTTPAGAAPNNYAVGINFIAPRAYPTTVVYWSPDGQTWDDSAILPAGQNSYTFPASTRAAVAQCTTQAPETFANVTTINGRRLILGTRAMSDVIEGPDS